MKPLIAITLLVLGLSTLGCAPSSKAILPSAEGLRDDELAKIDNLHCYECVIEIADIESNEIVFNKKSTNPYPRYIILPKGKYNIKILYDQYYQTKGFFDYVFFNRTTFSRRLRLTSPQHEGVVELRAGRHYRVNYYTCTPFRKMLQGVPDVGGNRATVWLEDYEAGEAILGTKMCGPSAEEQARLEKAEQIRIAEQERKTKRLLARAEKGEADAQYEYARTLNDFSQSWRWFCLAAHQGNAEAQYTLGNYYKFGKTVPNPVHAYLWYSLAGDIRHALRFMQSEIAAMTPTQFAEAQRLLAEWKPNPAKCDRFEHPFDGTWAGTAVIMKTFCKQGASRFNLTLNVENGQIRGGDPNGVYSAKGQVHADGRLEGATLNNLVLMEGSLASGIFRLDNRDCDAHYALRNIKP